ncbi:hypothetical protein E8E11_009112 [Didymella keratinophila]|nr:hypothetical protein E8E11_009112 [Didymella keratinophila]
MSSFEWDSDDQDAKSLSFAHEYVRKCRRETRFMITQRGYMGLAPAIAKQGDSCSIIFGCSTPSLIWPVPAANESTYTFLGPSFVLGSEYVESEKGTPHSADEDVLERHIPPGSPPIATSARPGSTDEGVVPSLDWRCFNDFGDDNDESWNNWAAEQDIYLDLLLRAYHSWIPDLMPIIRLVTTSIDKAYSNRKYAGSTHVGDFMMVY